MCVALFCVFVQEFNCWVMRACPSAFLLPLFLVSADSGSAISAAITTQSSGTRRLPWLCSPGRGACMAVYQQEHTHQASIHHAECVCGAVKPWSPCRRSALRCAVTSGNGLVDTCLRVAPQAPRVPSFLMHEVSEVQTCKAANDLLGLVGPTYSARVAPPQSPLHTSVGQAAAPRFPPPSVPRHFAFAVACRMARAVTDLCGCCNMCY